MQNMATFIRGYKPLKAEMEGAYTSDGNLSKQGWIELTGKCLDIPFCVNLWPKIHIKRKDVPIKGRPLELAIYSGPG